jgi:hypothetical protein
MIDDTDAGLVCRAGDPASLADAINRLLDEPAEARACRGGNGRSRILQMCDPARIAKARIEMYREAVATAQGRREASDDDSSMFAEWKRCEAAIAGDVATMSMPTFEGDITRWISLDRKSTEIAGAGA